ncbi:DUF4328 domain-containing protein, partial [Mycobacterium conspicuum]
TRLAAPAPAPVQRPAAFPRTPPQLPPGFRWIAVRPGAAPPVRRRRRHLGPTPRYAVIPRWGLVDRVEQAPETPQAPARKGPTAPTVRTTLFLTVLTLASAALVYVLRYVLLVINRNTLLNSVVAGAADWLSVAASVAAIVALIVCVVVLIRWLIARRGAAFSHYALPEQRSTRAFWVGGLVPFAHLLWAPVYVIELATLENHYARLQRPIMLWWIAWIFSYVVSIFAFASSFATDSQGIANNTVMMVFAYLFAAVAVAGAARVFEGFERKPVHRPTHRWVVVRPDGTPGPRSAAPVELAGQEPAA